jgi:hypothetical protein
MAGGLEAGERTGSAKQICSTVTPWKPAIS